MEERLKLVTSLSLDVIRLKPGESVLPQSFAKLGKYRYVNVCKISRFCGAIIFVSFQQITVKLGNFTNLKVLFPAESMEFS